MTHAQEAAIAAEFAQLFAEGQATPQGAHRGAICLAIAQRHGTTPQEVERIQQDHATMGPN